MNVLCGTYKTKSGAERYVTRQSAYTMQVHGRDVTGNYQIQPTVQRKDWYLSGQKFTLTYRVFFNPGATS